MLVFEEGGKPENPEKNPHSKGENQQQTQLTYDAGSGNRTRDTLMGGERSRHCATPVPLRLKILADWRKNKLNLNRDKSPYLLSSICHTLSKDSDYITARYMAIDDLCITEYLTFLTVRIFGPSGK